MSNNKTHGDLGLLQNRLFETPLMFEHGRLTTIVNVVTSLEGIPLRNEISDHSDEFERSRRMQLIHDGVLVIDIAGSLVKSTSGMIWDSGLTSYQSISEDLDFALEESSVRGVLLRIDSPGGEVHGAFELAAKIREFPKPIHASVDDMALSGGYAIASSTRRITVTNTGAVGSIGVLMVVRDETERDKAIGVKYHFVSAGKGKAALHPHKGITENDIKPFRVELNRVYGIFVDSVSRGRGSKISVEKVKEFGAGLAFGPMGIDLGLSDAVGSFDESLEFLQKEVSGLSNPSSIQAGLTMPANVTGVKFFFAEDEVDVKSPLISASDQKGEGSDETAKQHLEDVEKGGGEVKETEQEKVIKGEVETTLELKTESPNPALEVAQLCTLAGFPGATVSFLEKKVSLTEVRSELMKMKVADGEKEISSARGEHFKGDRGDSNVVVAACDKIATSMKNQMSFGREVG